MCVGSGPKKQSYLYWIFIIVKTVAPILFAETKTAKRCLYMYMPACVKFEITVLFFCPLVAFCVLTCNQSPKSNFIEVKNTFALGKQFFSIYISMDLIKKPNPEDIQGKAKTWKNK